MITLIGMGSGTPGSLTAQGLAALQGADRILGAKRLLATLPEGCTGNRQALYKPDEILACLARTRTRKLRWCTAGYRVLLRRISAAAHAAGLWHLLPGAARPFQRTAAGRRRRPPLAGLDSCFCPGCACDPVSACMNHKTVFFLTGGAETPATLCAALTAAGLGDAHALVGETLALPTKKSTLAPRRNWPCRPLLP